GAAGARGGATQRRDPPAARRAVPGAGAGLRGLHPRDGRLLQSDGAAAVARGRLPADGAGGDRGAGGGRGDAGGVSLPGPGGVRVALGAAAAHLSVVPVRAGGGSAGGAARGGQGGDPEADRGEESARLGGWPSGVTKSAAGGRPAALEVTVSVQPGVEGLPVGGQAGDGAGHEDRDDDADPGDREADLAIGGLDLLLA